MRNENILFLNSAIAARISSKDRDVIVSSAKFHHRGERTIFLQSKNNALTFTACVLPLVVTRLTIF